MVRLAFTFAILLGAIGSVSGDPPVASYIFPAGGQRGRSVDFHVGGLNLYDSCNFEMLGPGVEASRTLRRTKTTWFEGPLIPLPDSQQQEDYPKDSAGRVTIAADAPLGLRHWRLSTDQGATPAMKFIVGDLPEMIEKEIEGDPVPVEVKLPVTINGRIFPRENVDVWTFAAKKGQHCTCEVNALRLGSPLDARLEIRGPDDRPLAEKVGEGSDPVVRFTAPADGQYSARIHDVRFQGGQAYVYRLTITTDPYVDRVYPLGGRRGTTAKFELLGQGLPAEPVDIQLPANGKDDFTHRLAVDGKSTNPFFLDLDELPEYLEPPASPVAVPAMLNGRIGSSGDVGQWSVSLKKGEPVDFDLRAARLGSPLHGVLTLLDAADKELARSDAVASGLVDPVLHFTAPADGVYRVRVEERFRHRGGKEFAYRLRVAPPPSAADFRLTLAADALSIDRGQQQKLKVTAERIAGFQDPIALTVEGLPAGVNATNTTIPAGQSSVDILLKADAGARIQTSHLTIRGSANIAQQAVTRTAAVHGGRGVPDLENVFLAVTLPTPFKIVGDFDMHLAPRGTVCSRKYRIERDGYSGPIEVMLADHQARHLQGVRGSTITVPAGATEFEYAVSLPPWMEMGRTSRTCVMGVAHIKDADGEHVVSFTSINPNEQIVAVIEPDPLGIEMEHASISAEPGKSIDVGVTVSRSKGFDGPVKLELVVPQHMPFIEADPVEVPADKTNGMLKVCFAPGAKGPLNMPLVVRATLKNKGTPVVSEAKLDVHPAGR